MTDLARYYLQRIILIIAIVLTIYFAYSFAHKNFLAENKPLHQEAIPLQDITQHATQSKTSSPSISVGSTTLKLEIADTDAKRIQGLSGRSSLPQDTGLLFVFDRPDYYSFWMKDMNFSIDMMWLDENYKVVGIKENATPASFPESFKPQAPALYVLETNVGFVKRNNITISTQFQR